MSALDELLSRPEGRTLDFKRQEVALSKALKTLVAFANTAGGVLALGVADDRTVLGVDEVEAEEERYASAITDNIEPPLMADLEIAEHEGLYVRVGSTNRKATPSQREELRRLARAQTFGQRPCHGATMEDLGVAAIEEAFRPHGCSVDGGALESLGLVITAGGRRVPTNAGIILFGTAVARRRFFPDAGFRCARFLGTGKARFLDQLDPEGSVLQALDEVERCVRRNTRMAARIEAIRREDVPEYAPLHLREVLVNAVAHTDYSQQGMPLRVAIFDDRLEVENPGGWPVGFSESDFKAGISRPCNPAIAHILRELDIIERWGSGYRRIREASEVGGYPLPDWNDLGLVLRAVLHPHPDTHAGTGSSDVPANVPEGVTLNERQAWFGERVGLGERITSADLAGAFGVARKTAKRDIAALREAGLVRFVGPPKTGRYEIINPPSER